MIKAHNPNNLPTIDYRDLIELQPNSFKDLSEKNFDKLSNSFKVHGFITPYFVWKDKGKHFILDGHQRSRVLSTLEPNGLEVPYILIEAKNKQEAAKKLLAIDSRYGKRTAEGEQEFLDIFEIEQGYIEDVAVLEFEFEEAEEEIEAEEDDFDEAPPEIPITVLGDLYEIGEHRLLCGDSTINDSYVKLMGSEKYDMILTDPPYNVNYIGKTKDALQIENDKMSDENFKLFLYEHFVSIGLSSKAGAVYYIFQPDKQIHNFINAFVNAGNKYSGLLIWNKDSMVMSRGDYHAKHETVTYGWKEGAAHGWFADRKQVSVLDFARPKRNEEHPTMKPIQLLSYLITNSSKSGDLIGDGFLGSGSTMVASHQLKRKCYGMELDCRYADVIVKRMLKLDKTLNIKKNGIDETEKWLSKINEASDEEE